MLWAILKAALTYFALVFGAGFILGPIRVLWLIPLLGGEHAERYAELMEMPIMLAVMFFAARFVIRHFAVPPARGSRLVVGLLSLGLLVAAEMILGWQLRGLTPPEYFTARDPIAGIAYFLCLILFALLPALLTRSR